MAEVVKDNNEGGGEGGDQTAAKGTDAAKHWSDAYPEDIRGDLRGYDKPETLAKEHVDLKKKYVVPADPKEYEFNDEALDDIQKKNIDAFKAKAKEFGLTKDQFKNLTDYEIALSKQLRERISADQKKAEQEKQEQTKKGIEDLKTEWGNKFEVNINLAKKTMKSLFPASFGEFLETSGLGNHPEMVRAMVRLSESISEDVIVRNSPKKSPSNRDPLTGEPMLTFKSMK